ncbi:hypothetical protein [Oligoflexus tunisiensis]|uniref:hypothetical protein n=1 Tax=Oligoflexus tunisiensis TaxID=708132 RepID=UPI001C404DF7|nr:hypothetical protein [Oligoflexus tunisiensis]
MAPDQGLSGQESDAGAEMGVAPPGEPERSAARPQGVDPAEVAASVAAETGVAFGVDWDPPAPGIVHQ